MGSMCDSSLTLLVLSSITYNKNDSVSFGSSYFSSLFTCIVYSGIFYTNSYTFGVRDAFNILFKQLR